jgi:hypothetical protein
VCRDFGVSRKTGCKIFDRYKEHGQAARGDRSRRPCWLRGVTHGPGRTGWTLAEPEGVQLEN